MLFSRDKPILKFEIHSYDKDKPKELKGIKQSFSIDYILNKCKCQIFIKDNDLWAKHNDYFSPIIPPEDHELGMPLDYFAEKHLGKNRSKKFIYSDAWGSVMTRRRAWIKITNAIIDIKSDIFILDIRDRICRLQENLHNFNEYELCCTDMERFWENVINNVKRLI